MSFHVDILAVVVFITVIMTPACRTATGDMQRQSCWLCEQCFIPNTRITNNKSKIWEHGTVSRAAHPSEESRW